MKLVKLAEIFKVTSGGTPLKSNQDFYENGDVPWIKTGDLKSKFIYESTDYITALAVEKSSAKMFPKDTVLIAMYGATIGATSILKINATTNQACAAFLPTNDVVPEYLYYFFKANNKKIISLGVGGAQPNISGAILKSIKFPLINIYEQHKIVNILDKAQDVIEKRKEQLKELDELVKSQFIEMFDKCDVEQIELKNIANILGGLTKNAKRKDMVLKMPMLRVANVYFNRLELEQVVEIGVEEKEIERVLLKKGDLMFVEGNGSIEQIGRVALWNGEIENCIHQNHLIKVRFIKDVNKVYALYYFMSKEVREQIVKMVNSTSGLQTLSISKIGSLNIKIPPIELQEKFAHFAKQADKLKFEMESSLKELEDNFNSLIQRVFKGELFK